MKIFQPGHSLSATLMLDCTSDPDSQNFLFPASDLTIFRRQTLLAFKLASFDADCFVNKAPWNLHLKLATSLLEQPFASSF